MIGSMTYALAGMAAAEKRVEIRSRNIANVMTPDYQPVEPVQTSGPQGPVVTERVAVLPNGATIGLPLRSLAQDIVDLTLAANAYKASAKVIETGNDMQDALLDIIS